MKATLKNIEAAFAGESMAHIKYLYFAKQCRIAGDEATAKVFEDTAAQEIAHALGHLDLLLPPGDLSPAKCLEIAIEGETREYSEMYPEFMRTARAEGMQAAADEMGSQIEESREHAGRFREILKKAEKRFSALARVEEKHAAHYRDALENVVGRAS